MIDYLEKKIFNYCEGRKSRNVETNIYDVYNEFKKEWWNLSAVLYAKWLKDTSSFETKELSEQEW
tara:strand:- start:483 stop:677 length:195 start_codon:yes stop_codon:yes gene_type:complete